MNAIKGFVTWVGEGLISYYGTISILCGLLAFLIGLVDRTAATEKRVTRAGAAITVPFGLVLIYASIDPTAFQKNDRDSSRTSIPRRYCHSMHLRPGSDKEIGCSFATGCSGNNSSR